MNKNIFKIIVILLFLFVVFLFIKKQLNGTEAKNKVDPSQQIQNLKDEILLDKSSSKFNIEVLPTTELIKELNSNLSKYMDYSDDNSLINEVSLLTVKQRENSKDVVEKIEEYLNDVEKYQIQLASLQKKCKKNKENLLNLQKGIDEPNSNLSEMSFNIYYFESF